MKKVLALLVIGIMLTFGVFAAGKTEIEMWHTYSDTETEIFESKVIPAFEKANPDIKVKSTRMPYEGLKQQVIAAVSGGAAPDLMRMDIIWVPEFAKLGALEEVSKLAGFAEIEKGAFIGALNTNLYNGKYYGIPLNTNTKVAVYNKKLMKELGVKEIPKTMDELISFAKKAKAKGETWGIGVGGTSTWALFPYFWTLGGKVTDVKFTRSSGYLNSPDSINALTTLAKWYKDGLIGPSILGEQPDTWGGMQGDKYLMIDDGPWYFSIIGAKADEQSIVAPLPAGKGGSISVIGGEDLVMFKNTKHKEAAWKFAKWLLTDYPQKAMAQLGLIPTIKKIADTPEVKNAPHIQPYIKQLETAKPRIPSPAWEKMSEAIGLAYEKVIRGEADAKSALNEAAKLCDGYLAEK